MQVSLLYMSSIIRNILFNWSELVGEFADVSCLDDGLPFLFTEKIEYTQSTSIHYLHNYVP